MFSKNNKICLGNADSPGTDIWNNISLKLSLGILLQNKKILSKKRMKDYIAITLTWIFLIIVMWNSHIVKTTIR